MIEVPEVIDDPQYHKQVVEMANRLVSVLNQSDSEGVGVNALITLLAIAGQDSPLSQEDYCIAVIGQLNYLMSTMRVVPASIN